MLLIEKKKTGVLLVDSLYDNAVEGIKIILKHRYKMSAVDADTAIAISPLKRLFEQNAEIAAHTSNETWARYVHEYWKSQME